MTRHLRYIQRRSAVLVLLDKLDDFLQQCDRMTPFKPMTGKQAADWLDAVAMLKAARKAVR